MEGEEEMKDVEIGVIIEESPPPCGGDSYIPVTVGVIGTVFVVNAAFGGFGVCLGVYWMRLYMHVRSPWLVVCATLAAIILYNVMIFLRKQMNMIMKLCVLCGFMFCTILSMGLFCGLLNNISMIQLAFLVFLQSIYIVTQQLFLQTLLLTIICWVWTIYAFMQHQGAWSAMATFTLSCALCPYYFHMLDTLKQYTMADESRIDAVYHFYTSLPTFTILKTIEFYDATSGRVVEQ